MWTVAESYPQRQNDPFPIPAKGAAPVISFALTAEQRELQQTLLDFSRKLLLPGYP